MSDTIFALSSGAPPAAIAIIRISGPDAYAALKALVGREIEPRKPVLAKLRDQQHALLDEALVLYFVRPNTATGEDLVELHCHGGRAVIAAVENALSSLDGLRPATPGEFTRRAFTNGRLDLSEAEGLADLLSAQTELQRASAIAMANGSFSNQVEDWRNTALRLSAEVEAALDFSDEDDVDLPTSFADGLKMFHVELSQWLERPSSERLGEGFRVVLAGPPNSGKSTLFNALLDSEAAIISPIAGTTRDVLERSVSVEGVPFTFVDTAGLHDQSEDQIEQIGIERAKDQMERADLVLWLGAESEGPDGSWEIGAKADDPANRAKNDPKFSVSAATGAGIADLKRGLVGQARDNLPKAGEAALNKRQRGLVEEAMAAIQRCIGLSDLLLIGEELRIVRSCFDGLVGRTTTEDMLDALFGRFCIGK